MSPLNTQPWTSKTSLSRLGHLFGWCMPLKRELQHISHWILLEGFMHIDSVQKWKTLNEWMKCWWISEYWWLIVSQTWINEKCNSLFIDDDFNKKSRLHNVNLANFNQRWWNIHFRLFILFISVCCFLQLRSTLDVFIQGHFPLSLHQWKSRRWK